MANKLTREEVLTLWALAVANGKVFKIEKASKVRVLAVRAVSAGVVATKENRHPGQPINVGDWQLTAVKENDEPVLAAKDGEQIYVYTDTDGHYVAFDPAREAELTKVALADTWINTDDFFQTHYIVDAGTLANGKGIVRALPTAAFAVELHEEVEIETSWGAPAVGSYWLVAYTADPDTLEVSKYDFNIVDEQGAARAYSVVGPVSPKKTANSK